MVKKKTSVEDAVSEFFKEEKKELSDDLFDASNLKGLVNISISRITRDKNQPRKTFNSDTIYYCKYISKEKTLFNNTY